MVFGGGLSAIKRLRPLWQAVLVCCMVVNLAPLAAQRTFALRSLAMGSAGVALNGSPGPLSINPASLYYQQENQLMLTGMYGDSFLLADHAAEAVLANWQEPSTSARALFSSRFAALSIELEYVLQDRTVRPDQTVRFIANNISKLQLNAAYGNENVAVGIFALGGTALERTVVLDDEAPLLDYLQQTFLERYYPVAGNQYFNVGAGLLVSYEWISMGLATESLFQMDYSTNELVMDAGSIIEDLTVGMGFTTPVFDRDNELNLMVFSFAFDVSNVGDENLRQIHGGLEVKFQLLPSYSIAVRAGYRERQADLASLFALDGSQGFTTFGLGARLGSLDLNLLAEVPLATYQASWDGGDPISYRIGVTMVP